MYAIFKICPYREGVSPSSTLPGYASEGEHDEEPWWVTGVRATPQREQSQQNGRNLGPWTRRAELSSQSRAPSLNCYKRTTKRLPCRSHCHFGSVPHTQTRLPMPHRPTLPLHHIQSIQVLLPEFSGGWISRLMSRQERLMCKFLRGTYLYWLFPSLITSFRKATELTFPEVTRTY